MRRDKRNHVSFSFSQCKGKLVHGTYKAENGGEKRDIYDYYCVLQTVSVHSVPVIT